jgi:hypothetical protein
LQLHVKKSVSPTHSSGEGQVLLIDFSFAPLPFAYVKSRCLVFLLRMPPKAVVKEAAPNVYRDSLLGFALDTAVKELIANQGLFL